MHRLTRIFVPALILASLLAPVPTAAGVTSSVAPGLPDAFGGTIITSIPCFSAPGFFAVTMLEALAVPPYVTISTYILSFTSPYLSHITPHTGQFVVGNALGFYTCIIDPNPKHFIQWVDPVSVFYGTSI